MTRRLHAVASQETISAGTVTATLGLGSNIGDKSGNIDQAVAMLGQDGDVRVVAISRKYSSPPWGDLDQDWFVNACIAVATGLDVRALLARCQRVEQEMGRVRKQHWGPRIIDVDILTFGTAVIAEPDLVVPHPRIAERAFVLGPLSDIAPDLLVGGRAVAERWRAADRTGVEPF